MRSLNDLFKLNQKVVLIIGGAGYLGSAICETMAELGASVVITSRNGQKCVEYAEELSNRYGIQAKGYSVDIMDIESIQSLFENVKNDFGRLDVLINNAWSGKKNSFESISFENWNSFVSFSLTT